MNIKLKSLFVRTFAGGFGKQLLCATGIFLVVFLLAVGVRFFCVGESNDVVNKVLVEMISPVPYAQDVFTKAPASASQDAAPAATEYRLHGGLFWVYLLGSIVFSGLVIAIITNFLRGVGERYKAGEIRYRLSGHTVVLGYNSVTLGLLKHILEKSSPQTIILLQVTNNVQAVYKQLSVALSSRQQRRVLLIHADRNSEQQLERKLRVHLASRIFVLGDDDEVNHDAKNLAVVNAIASICKRKNVSKPIPCSVSLNNQSTFQVFQANDWSADVKQYLRAYPYNYHTNWAHKVLVQAEENANKIQYPSLDFEGIKKEDDAIVHLIVVGMTPMGMAMATEAAHIAHFPNFVRDASLKTKITFIDEHAFREAKYFMCKYSPLFKLSHWQKCVADNGVLKTVETHGPEGPDDFLDIEWEFIEGNIADPCLQNMIRECAVAPTQFVTLACCLFEIQSNIAIGYYLPREIYEHEHNTVLIYQQYTCSAIQDLQLRRYKNVYPFGMTNEGFEDDSNLILMAQCVNWCYNHKDAVLQNGVLQDFEIRRDEMERSWDSLPVCKQFSNVYNAMTIPTKQRSMGSATVDESMSIVEHNRWNVEELLLQFRPASEEEAKALAAKGKTKDELRGIHTCIIPYEQLEISVQEYDEMIVKASNNIQNIVKEWVTIQNR